MKITERTENKLLRRQELHCEFQGVSGKLTRQEAVDAVKKNLGFEKEVVRLIGINQESGTQNVSAEFYVYPRAEDEKRQLPRYIERRILPKEERKKFLEEMKKAKTAPKVSQPKK